jgi:menaquinone-specific isochorismate synthase
LEQFAIVSDLPAACPPIRVLKRTDNPDRQTWIQMVNNALAQIQTGALKKVVLARETTLQLDTAPQPLQIVAALNKKAMGATTFCIQFDAHTAFLGATPERLFRSQNQNILVEAVAGTRKRGKAFENELLNSAKDQHEFELVKEYFRQILPTVQFSPTSIHRTANVQHLFSQGSALLTHAPFALVESLHPTPALAGTPKQAALAWIQAQEPFARGLYGGIIGWEDGIDSEWVVAIRSCMLEGAVAKLYVGTGIVAGSDPNLEWEELEAKMALYASLFQEQKNDDFD